MRVLRSGLLNKGHFLLKKQPKFILLGVSCVRIGCGRSERYTSSATRHQSSWEKVDDNGSFECHSKNGLKEFILPRTKNKDISVMVWSAIWAGGRSDLVIMERDEESKRGGYSARSYQLVLRIRFLDAGNRVLFSYKTML